MKSTIHWVSAAHAVDAEVRLYETLFSKRESQRCAEGQDFTESESEFAGSCHRRKLEPSLRDASLGNRTSSNGSDISAWTPTALREAGVQSHRRSARHVGENRDERSKAIQMVILGLGGLLGDAACAVLKDGELKAAIEEAKLDARLRGPAGCRRRRSTKCLRLAGTTRDEVDCVAVVRPFARGPESHVPPGACATSFPKAEIVVVEHHQAHAASAFFASPFEEATVLTLDHAGDFRCGARWHAAGTQIADRKGVVLSRFAGPAVWRRDAAAGLSARARMNTKSSGSRLRATSAYAAVPRDSVAVGAADPSFFDGQRQSAGGFSPKFFERLASKTAPRFPQSSAARRARTAENHRGNRADAGRRRRESVPGRADCS